MADSSDLVVRGAFSDFKLGRVLQGDTPEDAIAYGEATLVVIEVVRGQTKKAALPVEFLLPYDRLGASIAAAEMAKNVPADELLLFLRHKRGALEGGLHRLVNFKGLWVSDPQEGLKTPLAEGDSHGESGQVRYASEIGTKTSLAGLIAHIR